MVRLLWRLAIVSLYGLKFGSAALILALVLVLVLVLTDPSPGSIAVGWACCCVSC